MQVVFYAAEQTAPAGFARNAKQLLDVEVYWN